MVDRGLDLDWGVTTLAVVLGSTDPARSAFMMWPNGHPGRWFSHKATPSPRVAEEKGFFAAEGLDYAFLTGSGDYGIHSVQRDDAGEVKSGAFETFGAGQLVTTAYSPRPSGSARSCLRPELYKHYHLRSVPAKYRDSEQ